MMNVFEGVPVLQRKLIRFALAPGAVVVAIGVVMYVLSESRAVIVWGLTAVVAGVWTLVWWRVLKASAKRRVIRTRGMCCTNCGYPMVSLAEAGNCPECGRTYYAQLAQRSWSRAAGMPFEE